MIPGPSGVLEALLSVPAVTTTRTTAIICHPHPLYGGTMQNKVVHTLDKAFFNHDMVTVRFNFRGVGKSEGQHDEARGEVDDLKAVVAWAREQLPGNSFILAGFSFGAYVAMKAALDIECRHLVTVAPPVNILDFSPMQQPACPWLLVQGMQDEIVDADRVITWASQFNDVDIVREPESGHFFHGKLNVLQQIIDSRF